MRELTFNGFLTRYVKELSYQNTTSVYKLVREAAESNPRLYEPLFLYVNLTGKEDEFFNAVKRTPKFMKEKLPDIRITASFTDFDSLPPEYGKVYASFLHQKNRSANDAHSKQLMYGKIMRLKEKKHVTNYRIYTDLKLNPSNFNSFIKHGDVSKYSLDKLRSVIGYLEAQ